MAQRMAGLLHQAGAAQILTENPVAAYTAAGYRTTSQEEDDLWHTTDVQLPAWEFYMMLLQEASFRELS